MALRLLTAVFGIPLFAWLAYVGGLPWAAFIAVLAAIGSLEAASLFAKAGGRPLPALSAAGSVGLVAAAYLSPQNNPWQAPFGPVLTVLLVIVLAASLVRRSEPVELAGATLLAAAYPGLFFAHLVLMRQGPNGLKLLILLAAAIWASDTAAYFAGRAFGRRRLAPNISPGKTVEGAVAGSAAGVAAAALAGAWAGIAGGAALGLAATLSGQAGDLAESVFKRRAGVKDSGRLLPGHGGVLDRFDSLLLAAPFVLYLYGWFQKLAAG